MLTLDKIATKLQTRDLKLSNDRTITIRALRASELDAVADLFPRPAPPLGKNPLAGSEAAPIPREDDVGYQKRVRRWYSDLRTAEAVLAIDLVFESPSVPGGPLRFQDVAEPQRFEWLRQAVEKLKDSLTEQELRAITETLERLGRPDMVREAIKILLVDRDLSPSTGENQIELPANYDTTETGLLMSAAARFGVGDPFAWIDALDPGKRALILADEIRARREEMAKIELAASLASMSGVLG